MGTRASGGLESEEVNALHAELASDVLLAGAAEAVEMRDHPGIGETDPAENVD